MGIFVPSATLPSGITVSNVYMSFTGEVVYTAQIQPSPSVKGPYKWRIQSNYKVFKDQISAKSGISNIRIDFATLVDTFDKNPYDLLYAALKQKYPGSSDVIDLGQTPQTSNLTVSNATLVALYKDLTNDSNTYVITEGTSNLVLSVDAFSQFSNAVNAFTFTIEEPPVDTTPDQPPTTL